MFNINAFKEEIKSKSKTHINMVLFIILCIVIYQLPLLLLSINNFALKLIGLILLFLLPFLAIRFYIASILGVKNCYLKDD